MIEKMKKAIIFIESSKKRESLQVLKNCGVVHLEPIYSQHSGVESLKKDKLYVENSITILSGLKKKSNKILPEKFDNYNLILDSAKYIVDKNQEIENLKDKNSKYFKAISDLNVIGNFAPQDLEFLSLNGYNLSLFILTKKQIKNIDKKFDYFIVGKFKSIFIIAFLNANVENFSYSKFEIPEFSITEYKNLIQKNIIEIDNLKKEIIQKYGMLSNLKYLLIKLEDMVEFENFRCGMPNNEDISYLKGYVPISLEKKLIESCTKNSIGLVLDDPSEIDFVPTKLKNNKIVSIIEPIFNFLDITPGYREFDISFFFLIFFSIFFAMIMGDAGYGLIFLILTIIMAVLNKVKGKKINKAHILFGWLSLCTIFWGGITGTWFGAKTLSELPILNKLVIPSIYSFSLDSKGSFQSIQFICFCIGIVHLTIAHIWKFFSEIKLKKGVVAIAQIGWISLAWGLFNLVLNMVVSKTLYPILNISMYAIYLGIALIMIFSNQEKGKNFFKGILSSFTGIISIALSWISMFADLISYIRLFAVGLASVKIAEAFNNMGTGSSTIVGIIFGTVVIILGHSLNIAMGGLSVIVHGVRLKMLEFSSHLGLEWSGERYKPFSNNKNLG